jgi:hypothetical protein
MPLISAGFSIEVVDEGRPTQECKEKHPKAFAKLSSKPGFLFEQEKSNVSDSYLIGMLNSTNLLQKNGMPPLYCTSLGRPFLPIRNILIFVI